MPPLGYIPLDISALVAATTSGAWGDVSVGVSKVRVVKLYIIIEERSIGLSFVQRNQDISKTNDGG